jgi:hypothetical protein
MSEKRQSERVAWRTDAEVHCQNEDVSWKMNVADISEGGCFVDSMVPLSEGTAVLVKFRMPGGPMLEVPGQIVYGQQGIGSAIKFNQLPPGTEAAIRNLMASLNDSGG